ncbi:MAG: DUF362 domain-containing protein [Candidatus Nealsonbacteria bacterium]
MDKVYFLKGFDKLNEASLKLLGGVFLPDSDLLVKIHFGEGGNKTALFPKDVEPIISALKSLRLKPTLIDTPARYNSPRGTVEGYEAVIKERGYDKLAPYLISNNSIKVQTKDMTVGVCKELTEAKGVLVVSHVKGHRCSGFGGAIKNLGMGGVTNKSKADEHILDQPVFISACKGCGVCVNLCPFGAIKMEGCSVKFNYDKCGGCSICILKCPNKCLKPRKAIFDDLLAQGASACINNFPKKVYYINLIKNITLLCDCPKDSGPIIAPDVGVLFSENPVAIDKASVDLINKINNRNVFLEENHKDPYSHVRFCAEYIGRSLDYELVEM